MKLSSVQGRVKLMFGIMVISMIACGGRDHGGKKEEQSTANPKEEQKQQSENDSESSSENSNGPSSSNKKGGSAGGSVGAVDSRVYGIWKIAGAEQQSPVPSEAEMQMIFKIEKDRFTATGQLVTNGKVYCRSTGSTQKFRITGSQIIISEGFRGVKEGENSGCELTVEKTSFGYSFVSDDEMTLSDKGEERSAYRQKN